MSTLSQSWAEECGSVADLRAVPLKLECASESPGVCVKTPTSSSGSVSVRVRPKTCFSEELPGDADNGGYWV